MKTVIIRPKRRIRMVFKDPLKRARNPQQKVVPSDLLEKVRQQKKGTYKP